MEKLDEAVSGRKEIDADVLEELEFALITADLGARTTSEILERIRQSVQRHQLSDTAQLKTAIKEHLLEILEATERPATSVAEPPEVILVVGVNGAGKTTSIGKLTRRLQSEGKTVLLCAADTFRAAAIEQLEVWAERTGAELDPAAGGIGSQRRGVRRGTGGQGSQSGLRHRRYRRTFAYEGEPDGGARKDATDSGACDSIGSA